MSTYVYDPAWEQERERLGALSALFDRTTIQTLRSIGIGEGWRCLEVGAGAGSITRWMADQVGATGHVLATDLNLSFMEDLDRGNVEKRTHNILTDPLAEGEFDLVHARALLEHLSEPEKAVEHMIAAARPGGWIVIEDTDYDVPTFQALKRYVYPEEETGLYERISAGLVGLFRAAGGDPGFGSRLPATLIRAGLDSVEADIHAPYYWGSQAQSFGRLTIGHLRAQLVGAGLVTEDDIERYLQLSDERVIGYVTFLMVTAWGQRPA